MNTLDLKREKLSPRQVACHGALCATPIDPGHEVIEAVPALGRRSLELGRYHDRRDNVVQLLNRLSAVAERLRASHLTSEITLLIKDLESEVFRLVVVGEFSRGKSSVINALLGERVLPTKVEPTTAVLSMISAGDEPSYRLHFHDGTDRTITAEEFALPVAPREPGRRDEHRRTLLSFPRSDSSGHLLRKNLHFQKENQPKYRSRGSSRGHQGGRRRYLAGKLYGL